MTNFRKIPRANKSGLIKICSGQLHGIKKSRLVLIQIKQVILVRFLLTEELG